jgi:hypothetical protein
MKINPRSLLMRICLLVTILALSLGFWGCGGGGGASSNGGPSENVPSGGSVGTVRGEILDDDTGGPLSGVTVASGARTATTDAMGRYTLEGVPAGASVITAATTDYDTENESVLVTAGQTATADFEMHCNIEDWLEYDTAYYWQVDAVDAAGSVISSGPQWSFTTESDASGEITPASVVQLIDEASAGRVVRTFLCQKGAAGCSIASVKPITDGAGSILAYVFCLSPKGCVIVPATKAEVLPPVLAYSFDSPAAGRLATIVRSDILLRLAAARHGIRYPAEGRQMNEALWNRYLTGGAGDLPARGTVYEPLLTTQWYQFAPYNTYCPMDPKTGERCYVGCPATAYAQIFNYWQCPTSITGLRGSYTTGKRGILIDRTTANFGTITYGTNGGTDADTAAKLSFALGVDMNMNYTSEASWSDTLEFARYLPQWDYQTASVAGSSVKTAQTVDLAAVVTDIKARKPVVMLLRQYIDGQYESGHAVVVDGYDENEKSYHLNLGWESGRPSNWWYTLTSGSFPASYNNVDGYVYNIKPKNRGANPQSSRQRLVSRAASPQNPCPPDGYDGMPVDQIPYWDPVDNAEVYNCYVWKAGQQKPSLPSFTGLSHPAADSNYQAGTTGLTVPPGPRQVKETPQPAGDECRQRR